MGLKVIGAGFGRTGTHSLKLALELLGFGPCHHMYEIRNNPAQLKYWQAAAQGEKVDWATVFSGYCSQMDWPGSKYWMELSESFPNAKVILTTRDVEEWLNSIHATILPSTLIGRQVTNDPFTKEISEMIYQTAIHQIFDDRLNDREYAKEVFLHHIKLVKKTVAHNRLLTFDVKDGWEPLCKFLGVDIPEVPFPKTNSRQDFIASKKHMAKDAG